MRIDLTAENFNTSDVITELHDYFAQSRTGRQWYEQLFFRLTEEKLRYLQPFLERALAGIVVPVSYYRAEDWWECAVMSAEYFREAFAIDTPIEVIYTNDDPNDIIMYSCVYDKDFKLSDSEIVIATDSMQCFPGHVPPASNLAAILAHECWHAHQNARASDFLCQRQRILDLERIDPTDPVNRGVLYYLSNVILYEPDYLQRPIYYRNQLAEAEALYIGQEIEKCLIG